MGAPPGTVKVRNSMEESIIRTSLSSPPTPGHAGSSGAEGRRRSGAFRPVEGEQEAAEFLDILETGSIDNKFTPMW